MCRRGCAPTICSGSPTSNRGLVVGTGDLSELALGWCTYGVGDHMSHYNVNASVAKTLIQHLIRFVAASGDVSEETARILPRHPGYRNFARNWCRPTRAAPSSRPSRSSAPTRCRTSTCSISPVTVPAVEDRLSSSHHAWSDAERGAWPADIPASSGTGLLASPKSSIGCGCSCGASSPTSSNARRCPNGPKISSGGSLSPRGDWRAPSDAQCRRLARRTRRERSRAVSARRRRR